MTNFCPSMHSSHSKNDFVLETSVGAISILWNQNEQLTAIHWSATYSKEDTNKNIAIPLSLQPLIHQLKSYFQSGEPIELPIWNSIDCQNWSRFQLQVYDAITKIPHGETRPYAWVAQKVGQPRAIRAVGQALRNNLLPILIPCHRVVGKNTLGGFMGKTDLSQPELKFKNWLIEIENRYHNPLFPFLNLSPTLNCFAAWV